MSAALADLIRAEIAKAGPMGLARYMDLCLAHPEHGYYRTRDPLGALGDFTTAPEISQIFGELLGLWLVQVWLDQDRPERFALVELGSGRGTLMQDALRAARMVPGFADAAQLCLVETSPGLREAQAARLAGHQPSWLDRVEDLPDLPLLVIANEFFDALPIAQWQWQAQGQAAQWRERGIDLHEGQLIPVLTSAWPGADPIWRAPNAPQPGDVFETSPASSAVLSDLAQRIARRGGAALVIDYGYEEPESRGWTADTFQALQNHKPVSPLAEPGQADLTAHVNFSALARSASATRVAPVLSQGSLLRLLGAEARAAQLARSAPERAEEIAAGLHRLTHPDEMGLLFKAMALCAPAAPPLPAFEPAPLAPSGETS